MASIDVVIPNYRYGRYLRCAVESVLRQGIDRLRVLIIDNASDDDSVAVARALVASDPRIALRARERNLGPHASFNEGIDWAEAEYMLILCSDDYLLDGALSRAIAVLEANRKAGMALGLEAHAWDGEPMPDLSRTESQMTWRIEKGFDFIHAACASPTTLPSAGAAVVRTAIQKRAGHYRPELRYNDDFEMLLRLAKLGCVARSDAFQAVRREHAQNMTRQFWNRRVDPMLHLEDAYRSFFRHEGAGMPQAGHWLAMAQTRLGEAAWWAAMPRALRGQIGEARELLSFAFDRAPRSRWFPPLGHLGRVPGLTRHLRRAVFRQRSSPGLPQGSVSRP
jgi:glycosyltransferase involved in cell wall biosynthesis